MESVYAIWHAPTALTGHSTLCPDFGACYWSLDHDFSPVGTGVATVAKWHKPAISETSKPAKSITADEVTGCMLHFWFHLTSGQIKSIPAWTNDARVKVCFFKWWPATYVTLVIIIHNTGPGNSASEQKNINTTVGYTETHGYWDAWFLFYIRTDAMRMYC